MNQAVNGVHWPQVQKFWFVAALLHVDGSCTSNTGLYFTQRYPVMRECSIAQVLEKEEEFKRKVIWVFVTFYGFATVNFERDIFLSTVQIVNCKVRLTLKNTLQDFMEVLWSSNIWGKLSSWNILQTCRKWSLWSENILLLIGLCLLLLVYCAYPAKFVCSGQACVCFCPILPSFVSHPGNYDF